MAALFILALLLILWQCWRTRPLPAVGFTMVYEPGGQILPLAVPSWREPPDLPADRQERLLFLEARSIGSGGASGVSPCRLFLRVSAHHWLQRPVSGLAPGVFHLPPEELLDDDDGDGDPLDPGELTSGAAGGAEAEVFCG